jgi:hypothetical protein
VLLDGRVLTDTRGRSLLLSDPTDLYPHGILGDRTEPQGIVILASDGAMENHWSLDDRTVFETLAPIWIDLDRDGSREIVITRSGDAAGASLQVFSETGDLVAAGPPIGAAFRWTHLLAVGPLGPDGAQEIVTVRTPHIGGVLEYYRLRGSHLELVHARPGFSTHRIGSRNLDTAVAADLDGDGRAEVLLPSQDFRTLHLVARSSTGSRVIWSRELDGAMSSNIAVVTSEDTLALALGTAEAELLIWD